MFSRDRWQEIFETIRKNKLRTFLSGFTVALGILIFIILFGFGNGLKNTFKEFSLTMQPIHFIYLQEELQSPTEVLKQIDELNLRTTTSKISGKTSLSF